MSIWSRSKIHYENSPFAIHFDCSIRINKSISRIQVHMSWDPFRFSSSSFRYDPILYFSNLYLPLLISFHYFNTYMFCECEISICLRFIFFFRWFDWWICLHCQQEAVLLKVINVCRLNVWDCLCYGALDKMNFFLSLSCSLSIYSKFLYVCKCNCDDQKTTTTRRIIYDDQAYYVSSCIVFD